MTEKNSRQPVAPSHRAQILVVDDDRLLRGVLALQLEELGYATVEAGSGGEALVLLSRTDMRIDAILLDREMPGIGGMDFLPALRKIRRFQDVPVVMITGSGGTGEVRDGIAAGVYYYLVKPVTQRLLASVVAEAVAESRRLSRIDDYQRQYRHLFALLEQVELSVRTLGEADEAAQALALAFPDPERAAGGIAALLENAIEHGHYGLGQMAKAALLAQGRYEAELERLAALPEHADKHVTVFYRRESGQRSVTVRDQGLGFDWRPHMRQETFPFLSDRPPGIVRAVRHCFDNVIYNAAGNSVTAVVAG